MEISEKINDLIKGVQDLLERLKTRSRDADKIDYRNVVSVNRAVKINSETKKGYWVSHEYGVSLTVRFDDDEPNKAQNVDDIKAYEDKEIEAFENWYNKRYNSGSTPVKRSKSTRF